MGLLTGFRPGIRAAELTAAAYALPAGAVAGPPLDLASPWVPRPTHLAEVFWSDLFGADFAEQALSRAGAMAVPAVARARHIICGTVARIPLRAYRGNTALEGAEAPSWIDSTAGPLSPYHRMLYTVDDLLFHGWSCWSRVNAAEDGRPLRMDRVAMGRWSLDENGRVKVDNGSGTHVLVDQRTVALIPGPHEGLLVFAQTAIKHARDLQNATLKAAQTPAAHVVLRQTAGTPLTDDQIDTLLTRWAKARKGEHGGVGFIGLGLEADEMGAFSDHLLESGRNAAAVDIARAASLPADLLDAAGEQSLTYQNARDNDSRAIQYGVGLYLSAISAALSQDSITPRGQSVRFDLEEWLQDPVPASPQATTPAQVTP